MLSLFLAQGAFLNKGSNFFRQAGEPEKGFVAIYIDS